METVLDVVGFACLAFGSILCLTAAIGVVRFPDLLSRMHAGTKPQVLGLLLVITGVALRLREPGAVAMLVLIGIFQLVTVPVGAHMLARAAHRAKQAERE